MNYYVYMIINKVNGMKYIGKRSCTCPIEKDSYMGSGTKLKSDIDKFGIENFEKVMLAKAFSESMVFELENYYIKKADAVESEMYYNETYGGTGSSMFYHEDPERRKRVRQILSEKNKGKNAGANSPLSKKVICLNNNKIFGSEREACRYIGRGSGYIKSRCRRLYLLLTEDFYIGRGLSTNGTSSNEKLYWLLYEDYLSYIETYKTEPLIALQKYFNSSISEGENEE